MENREKVEAVQRMQAYIEDHLSEPITLHQLAAQAGYSPWHSSRIFKELLGKTPFDYIRSLRLTQAALSLKEGRMRILDVALDYVFDSHEGFTRAFTREFGICPKTYCKDQPAVKLFMPPRVQDYYLTIQKGDQAMTKKAQARTVFVQVVERPARKLILKRGKKATHYFEYCEEMGCDIWEVLTAIKGALYEPIGMWMPDSLRPAGTSVYTQGVEVPRDYAGSVPEGFEVIDLAACKLMVFQGQPYDDENYGEAIGEVWDMMKSYDPTLYGFTWADEEGPRFQLAPMGYRGYIEARPVRQANREAASLM
ncbi:AraC family transcriptional regulator [Gorillibacterium sp. CAU 1737]|uniref:AraC family transcriptional regulator n=1 Tax=Gorillibacterium sp. CAU 1737 TaxID=3140362 RepID=UPI003261D0BB